MSIPSAHQADKAVNMNAKPDDLVAFAHCSLWSPANSTSLKALQRRFLPPFPGLSTKTLRKHPPQSEATIKGHPDSARENANGTKADQIAAVDLILQELLNDAFPPRWNLENAHTVFALPSMN